MPVVKDVSQSPLLISKLIIAELKREVTERVLTELRPMVEEAADKYIQELSIHVEKFLSPDVYGETIRFLIEDRRKT